MSSAGTKSEGGSGGLSATGQGGSNGGATSNAGSGGAESKPLATGGNGGHPATMPVLDLIDDLEDGNRVIRTVNNPRRDGIWDTSNDGTPGASQVPAPNEFKPVLLGMDTPYPGDLYAAHTKGAGFKSYGAFLNVSMRVDAVYENVPQYDASKYSGLSFWAKTGGGDGAQRSMDVRYVSGDTDPRGHQCKAPSSNVPQSELCFNHYYTAVTLKQAWTLYQRDFNEDFLQGADGKVFPTINLNTMYGLEFYFASEAPFELWIDDLSFIKK